MIFKWFKKKELPPVVIPKPSKFSNFSTEENQLEKLQTTMDNALVRTFQRTAKQDTVEVPGAAMDSALQTTELGFSSTSGRIPSAIFLWYTSQSFIGYQMCSIIAQNTMVDKACYVPAKDAVRMGFEITANEGEDIDLEILKEIEKGDLEYRLNENLVEFCKMGRVFGIRIAMFKVESSDPQYYSKPFNIDGVLPGTYKGIVQIDPYWVTPELDGEAAADPSSVHFYEPTWWRINGQRYHRTHLVIIRGSEVADLLKPTYYYGGISIPQKIFERVYAAERTANEAPLLALTKRSTVLAVDTEAAIANQAEFERKMQHWVYFRDNYAVKIIGEGETVQQFDTSLSDLDAVIMTQYQLVAAASNVPATKLLGTSPKGFNATGEYEESNYHQELESIQTHDLTPMVERHHLLLIKSKIAPQFNIAPFTTKVVWRKLDSMTAKEKAELNKMEAETDAVLIAAGAIDGEDARNRIIANPDSGYNGLSENTIAEDPEENYLDTENDPSPEENIPHT